MNRKTLLFAIAGLALGVVAYMFAAAPARDTAIGDSPLLSGEPQTVPIPGMVTLVDLGANACAPCRRMSPILRELSEAYAGSAAIVYMDVWVHDELVDKYGVQDVPTQVFFDAQGVERFRHVGFMERPAIEAKLAELGAFPKAGAAPAP